MKVSDINRFNNGLIKFKPWMGCLGFLGPIFYFLSKSSTAFLFNGLFAFFALYLEGKLSNSIKDVDLTYSKLRAGDLSGKIGLFGVIIIINNAFSNPTIKGRYAYLIMCLPTILAFQIVARSFLLYKYAKKTRLNNPFESKVDKLICPLLYFYRS